VSGPGARRRPGPGMGGGAGLRWKEEAGDIRARRRSGPGPGAGAGGRAWQRWRRRAVAVCAGEWASAGVFFVRKIINFQWPKYFWRARGKTAENNFTFGGPRIFCDPWLNF
jgi:hypothetical protein